MIGPTLITDLQWKGYLIFMFMNLAFLPVRFVLSPHHLDLCLPPPIMLVRSYIHAPATGEYPIPFHLTTDRKLQLSLGEADEYTLNNADPLLLLPGNRKSEP